MIGRFARGRQPWESVIVSIESLGRGIVDPLGCAASMRPARVLLGRSSTRGPWVQADAGA